MAQEENIPSPGIRSSLKPGYDQKVGGGSHCPVGIVGLVTTLDELSLYCSQGNALKLQLLLCKKPFHYPVKASLYRYQNGNAHCN